MVIGIDLGGTAIKLGCFTVDGTCIKSLTVPTPQPATPIQVDNSIAAGIANNNIKIQRSKAIDMRF